MKKIVIVNNNMKVGGVQKSLYNLLWSIDTENQYDVTLLLFSKTGEYIDKLPRSVKVVECAGPFRYLGKSQDECKNSRKDTVIRGFFAIVSRMFGRRQAVRLMLLRQPMLSGDYDCAISYLHNGRRKSFYGGTQDYVLECIHAEKKIAFVHCDYSNCGADHAENNRMMERFDKIAACSDGCRNVFIASLPHLTDKCVTVPNCHRYNEIKAMAEEDPPVYDNAVVNVITVARLSHEKGVERALRAVQAARAKGARVKLHIIGHGPMYDALCKLAEDIGVEDHVIFYGEQSNPYRYMKHADLFLLTSYHEAAPLVIDEARALGIPVLTTATTSSQDMVSDRQCGWVCENSQEALNEAFCRIVGNRDVLSRCRVNLLKQSADNKEALTRFRDLMEN